MTDEPIQSASERNCCETATPVQSQHARSSSRLGRLSTPAAVGSAILSSACCWLPLLLLAFGLSAGGVAGLFEAVRPFFLVAAVLFLGTGFYFAYVRKPVCKPGEACAVPNPKLLRFNRVMLWVATALVMAFALFPYYSPALIRAFAGSPAASMGTSGPANPPLQQTTRIYHIEGMTCAACAARLEVQLAQLPGVTEARVSFEDRTATIRSAADEPGDDAVRKTVEQSGFKLADRSLAP